MAKSKSSKSAAEEKIDHRVRLNLVRDIEEKGIPFNKINLKQLCDNKPGIFGLSATPLRRSVQKEFDRLKRLHPRNYIKLLKEPEYRDIIPGPFTFARMKAEEKRKEEAAENEIEEEGKTVSTADNSTTSATISTKEASSSKTNNLSFLKKSRASKKVAWDESSSELESEENSIAEDSSSDDESVKKPDNKKVRIKKDDIMEKMTESFSGIELGSNRNPPTPIRKIHGVHSSLTSPNRNQPSSANRPPAKPVDLPGFLQPPPDTTPLIAATAVALDGIASAEYEGDIAYKILNFRRQLGTKANPYIIMAKPDHPEQNGIVCISPIYGKEVENFTYDGFHIRISVEIPDFQSYNLFVPKAQEYTHLVPLLGRVLMMTGPSLPFSQRYPKLYHRKDKVKCAAAKKAHEKTEGQMKGDPSRNTSYYVIVFDEDVDLDNSIFSKNNFDVTRYNNGIKFEAEDKDVTNDFKRDLNFMNIWWQIAKSGGERIRADGPKESIDASTLLD